jgi:hypothetical protein
MIYTGDYIVPTSEQCKEAFRQSLEQSEEFLRRLSEPRPRRTHMEKQGVIQEGVTPPEDEEQAGEKKAADKLEVLEEDAIKRMSEHVAEECQKKDCCQNDG